MFSALHPPLQLHCHNLSQGNGDKTQDMDGIYSTLSKLLGLQPPITRGPFDKLVSLSAQAGQFGK